MQTRDESKVFMSNSMGSVIKALLCCAKWNELLCFFVFACVMSCLLNSFLELLSAESLQSIIYIYMSA